MILNNDLESESDIIIINSFNYMIRCAVLYYLLTYLLPYCIQQQLYYILLKYR
jgi:hypothetical protein